jgi:hypothetical protein
MSRRREQPHLPNRVDPLAVTGGPVLPRGCPTPARQGSGGSEYRFVTNHGRIMHQQNVITEKRHSDGLGLLIVSIFATLLGIPKLDGANCAGQWSLFDEPEKKDRDRTDVVDSALRLCELCPALADCADWYDSLPLDERPTGVIAGQFHPFTRRPAREAA